MGQIKHREVIRDDYGSKHYEIIRFGEDMFVYDYDVGRFLVGEEIKALQNELNGQNETTENRLN